VRLATTMSIFSDLRDPSEVAQVICKGFQEFKKSTSSST
jgi:hypothetical protein